MQLVPFDRTGLAELIGWFPDEPAARRWGGPRLRYPLVPDQFAADLMLDKLISYGWTGESGQLNGFGQCYRKAGRCHLARIVVAPACRGKGQGRALVRALATAGCAAIGTDACSLYVLKDNAPALACYESLGFAAAPDPEPPAVVIPGCRYLVAELAAIRSRGSPA